MLKVSSFLRSHRKILSVTSRFSSSIQYDVNEIIKMLNRDMYKNIKTITSFSPSRANDLNWSSYNNVINESEIDSCYQELTKKSHAMDIWNSMIPNYMFLMTSTTEKHYLKEDDSIIFPLKLSKRMIYYEIQSNLIRTAGLFSRLTILQNAHYVYNYIFDRVFQYHEKYKRSRKETKMICDVGIGCGISSHYLNKYFSSDKYVFFDSNIYMLALSKSLHFDPYESSVNIGLCNKENVEYIPGFIENLPSADNTFDHLNVAFVLNDIPKEYYEFCMKEMYRVVKPGGTISIVDYILNKSVNSNNQYEYQKNHTYLEYPYLQEFENFDFKTNLKIQGFEEIIVEDYFNFCSCILFRKPASSVSVTKQTNKYPKMQCSLYI